MHMVSFMILQRVCSTPFILAGGLRSRHLSVLLLQELPSLQPSSVE